MVALGDPRVNANAFAVNCPAKGKARWIDSRTWSYDFDHDLPAGLRCNLHPQRRVKDPERRCVCPASRKFTFDTGGPSIVESRPYADSSDIDGEASGLCPGFGRAG